MAALIERFHAITPPAEPFELYPWAKATNATRFLTALQADIAAGPHGPRGRFGALARDLERLVLLFETGVNLN
jgi:hypothetical protein